MSDEISRPNAKYNLSKSNKANPVEEENLTFYYNRERRLEKAPQSVRDLYNPKKRSGRFNLFGPLVADKPRATLFFSIVILCAVLLIISLMGLADTSYTLEGSKLEISGIKYENAVIVVVRKIVDKKSKVNYTGGVEIAVSPVAAEEDFPIFHHRIYFNPVQEEEFRFAVPFNSDELAMVLKTERGELKLILKTE